MAMGRPAIATAWSGPAAFVDETVGWPLGFRLVPVPPEAVAEVPVYAGHAWAEPDLGDLARALRDAHERPDARRARGRAARGRAEAFDHRRVAAGSPSRAWPRASRHEHRLARPRAGPLPVGGQLARVPGRAARRRRRRGARAAAVAGRIGARARARAGPRRDRLAPHPRRRGQHPAGAGADPRSLRPRAPARGGDVPARRDAGRGLARAPAPDGRRVGPRTPPSATR